MAGRQLNPRATRDQDHRRRFTFESAFFSEETIAESTGPVSRIRPPAANSISTTPAGEDGRGDAGAGSGKTATAENGDRHGRQSCCRHRTLGSCESRPYGQNRRQPRHHGRNNPLFLSPRPMSATLHRRDYLNRLRHWLRPSEDLTRTLTPQGGRHRMGTDNLRS
jgi:hypothetical protein